MRKENSYNKSVWYPDQAEESQAFPGTFRRKYQAEMKLIENRAKFEFETVES